MTKPKIGVQAMMLKEKFEEIGAYETLRKMTELGYRSVEISQVQMTKENVDEIKRAKEAFDIDIASLSCVVEDEGAGVNDALESQFDKIVNDCKTLGVDILRIGMLPFANMKSLELVLEFTRKANEYAIKLKEHGIRLFYHNHHVEFMKFDDKFMLDIIAQECPDLGFELDLHWIQRGGADPIDILRRYADRAEIVHIKDYRIGQIPDEAFEALSNQDVQTFYNYFVNIVEFAEIGEGSMDYKKIIDECIDLNIRYLLVEQDMLYGRDPFDCLITSRDNLYEMGYKELF